VSEVLLPASLMELWTALARWPQAGLFAGGTDLLVRLRRQQARPEALVCLERVTELMVLEEREGGLFLGAGVTHTQLLAHPLVQQRLPVLAQALAVLGSPLVRNMGTLGGNLVTASPAGDILPPFYALGAQVELRSAKGSRSLPIHRFILGPGRVDLQPGEIVTGVVVDGASGYNLQHYEKVGQRQALAIAVVSLAALLRLSPEGLVEKARLAWGSVGPTVVTCPAAEAVLVGRPLTLVSLQEAAGLAQEAVSPIDDLRASAAYRRAVAGNLLLRLAHLA